MIRLEEYIDKISDTRLISYVPTYSSHSTLAKRYINEILSDYPEYQDIIQALISYPLQKWAYLSREKINIDIKSIDKCIKDEQDSFFGINEALFLKNQKKRLELSSFIIDFIENEVLAKQVVLSAIHGYKQKDISKYIMVSHYKANLLDVCKKYYKKYKEHIQEVKKQHQILDDDIQFVYHKADLLIRMRSILEKQSQIKSNINYLKTLECIDLCISCLDTYYLNDPKLSKVAKLYSLGYKETQIAQKVGKSRSYVRRMKKEAAIAISYVIWGYFNV